MAANQLRAEYTSGDWKKLLESRTDSLFLEFCDRFSIKPDSFDGAITLAQLDDIEVVFGCCVYVYELVLRDRESDQSENWRQTASANELAAILVRSSTREVGETLFLDICQCHFSLIVDIHQYCSSFLCDINGCKRLFSSRKQCQRHQAVCGMKGKRKVRCTGGGYEPQKSLFEQLDCFGINVPESDRYLDYFATYDCETTTQSIPVDEQLHGQGTLFEAQLVLASISVCTSVTGFEKPKFFLSRGSPQGLVDECLEYLSSVCDTLRNLLKVRYSPALDKLQSMIHSERDAIV